MQLKSVVGKISELSQKTVEV